LPMLSVALRASTLTFLSTPTSPTEIYTLSLHDALPICGNTSHERPKTMLNVLPDDFKVHVALTEGREIHAVASFTKPQAREALKDRKSTRLNSSHVKISYAVFCLKKKRHSIIRAYRRPL